MHLTLKKAATKPAAAKVLQQQARFDTFIEEYSHERPHQALGMKVPGDVYEICFNGRKVNLSHAFAGQNVGVTQVGDRIWLVTFMQYDLGYFDDETCTLEPIENPFGSKALPMSPE